MQHVSWIIYDYRPKYWNTPYFRFRPLAWLSAIGYPCDKHKDLTAFRDTWNKINNIESSALYKRGWNFAWWRSDPFLFETKTVHEQSLMKCAEDISLVNLNLLPGNLKEPLNTVIVTGK